MFCDFKTFSSETLCLNGFRKFTILPKNSIGLSETWVGWLKAKMYWLAFSQDSPKTSTLNLSIIIYFSYRPYGKSFFCNCHIDQFVNHLLGNNCWLVLHGNLSSHLIVDITTKGTVLANLAKRKKRRSFHLRRGLKMSSLCNEFDLLC